MSQFKQDGSMFEKTCPQDPPKAESIVPVKPSGRFCSKLRVQGHAGNFFQSQQALPAARIYRE